MTNRADAYERDREAANVRSLARSRQGRDISSGYPPAGDLDRRAAAADDFRFFCETYFAAAFHLDWSKDHLRVIAKIQDAVLHGGLFALAMPRGSGKTTLCERAAIWALLYGHRRFVCLIGSTDSLARDCLERIKTELEMNDLLAEDFRQVVYPIRRLENNGRKSIGQLFDGQQTRITWAADRLTLPIMPASACDGPNVGGSVIAVAGLTGAIRGMSHVLPSGEILRPDLALVDDPQTRQSAMSPAQSAEREAIIRGDVLGMAGPGRRIACLMPCTVICEGDLADTMLDLERNPQWRGERTKAIYAWPSNEKLWEEYLRLRADGHRSGTGVEAANRFYAANREAMDAGAEVAWPAKFNADEVSAIQHCVNLRADIGEEAFGAEYENAPRRAAQEKTVAVSAAEVAAKLSCVGRGVAPLAAEHITAFIDVHDALLFWCVCAWTPDFTGWVIDYGVYPKQARRSFTLRNATKTLPTTFPGAGREGCIRAGLDALADEIHKPWPREDGVTLSVGRCLVDAGYVPDVVFDFCSQTSHKSVMASRGMGIGAKKSPMSEWAKKAGERHGWNWLTAKAPGRSCRLLRFDANHWKTFIHTRLATRIADVGCLSLFGRDQEKHSQFGAHIAAEAPELVTASGRSVYEWSMRPSVTDNHWLDCLVGCAVGGSTLGAALPKAASAPQKPKKRVSYAKAQREARSA